MSDHKFDVHKMDYHLSGSKWSYELWAVSCELRGSQLTKFQMTGQLCNYIEARTGHWMG